LDWSDAGVGLEKGGASLAVPSIFLERDC
jgi:hypothetical protein